MENRRRFLDEVAMKLNIKNPRDWGKVTTRRFFELGGISLLKYYNRSLFACLQSVYKGDRKFNYELRTRCIVETRVVRKSSSLF